MALMKAFTSDHFPLRLPEGHRFPMAKYQRLRERVAEEGLAELVDAPRASDEDLLRAHDAEYIRRVQQGLLTPKEIRKLGLPWSPLLVERAHRVSGATMAACRAALAEGVAATLAGGTHHAFRDHGGGYCVFNDSAVAARAMQAEGRIRRAIIIDCDVHQGDGTAAILADDRSIFTFSIHGANNYPYYKQKSDLDIELPNGTGDREYLDMLEVGLQHALALAQADLAIYLAGADPYERDRFGKLKMSKAGLQQRDELVLALVRARRLPIAVSMAGGYAPDIEDIVDIQLMTIHTAARWAALNAAG